MNQKLYLYNSNSSQKKIAIFFIIPIGGKLCNERMVTLRKRLKKKPMKNKYRYGCIRLILIECLMAEWLVLLLLL